jgi:hypothetical protein
MYRTAFVIESTQGYLTDIEHYTKEVGDSVLFADFDNAVNRLKQIKEFLKNSCWINEVKVPFPTSTKPH